MNSQPEVLARPPPWRTQSDARAFPGVTGVNSNLELTLL